MRSAALGGLAVAGATLAWMCGCGDANSSRTNGPISGAPATTPSSSSTRTSGPPSPDAATEATVSIRGFAHGSDGSALLGAAVCLYRGFSIATDSAGTAALVLHEASSCVKTAGDGSFAVAGAHTHDSVILTFNGDGFSPLVRGITTQTSDITLPSDQNVLMPVPLAFLGSPADASKGQIAFSVLGRSARPAPEMSVAASAFGILTGFGGPSEQVRYVDSSGAPVPGATSGTRGGFVNVPSGLYQVRFEKTSVTCDAVNGEDGLWAPESDATTAEPVVFVPVLPGYVSAPVVVSCANAI